MSRHFSLLGIIVPILSACAPAAQRVGELPEAERAQRHLAQQRTTATSPAR